MRLTRAMIFVKDLPRMTAFYTETLGLRPVESARLEYYVELESGSATLSLCAIPPELHCNIPIPAAPRESAPIKLSFEVSDLESERRPLEALGVTVLSRPWRGFYFVDPECNVFGLYCCP